MRRWLTVAGAGVVVVVAGYVTLVPANYGTPLDGGIENRVNMIAAFGYIAIVYAAAMIAGTLLVRRLRRPPALAPLLALALALLMTAGFASRLDDDKKAYDASYAQQRQVLKSIGRAFGGRPPRGATVYASGYASFTAPGVPVFAWIWDLNPALKVSFGDPTLGGFPVLPGTTWTCAKHSMYPQNAYGTGPGESTAYGNGWLVDVGRGVAQRIDTRAECRAAGPRFPAGPLKGGADCALLGGGPATRLPWACGRRPRV
jgi:hypothetical protein